MAFLKKRKDSAGTDGQHTVLLVDDEPDNLEVLAAILTKNFRVLMAEDGQTALDLVSGIAAPERVSLLVTDQRMPGMSGVDLCERMATVSPNTVCIIVTGYIDLDAIVDSINRTRIFHFMIKPFERQDLELTVRRALDSYDMKLKLDDHVQNLETKVAQRTLELQQSAKILQERNNELQAANAEAQRAHQKTEQALEALRRSTSQLAKAEKMAALGQLMEGMAHELNTPVGIGVTAASALQESRQGLVRLLENGTMKKADLSGFLETVERGAAMISESLGHAADLIQSFKSIAVERSTEPRERFDLRLWLEGSMESLGWQLVPHGIRYRIDCPPGLELVSYSDALFQVLNCLVRNVAAHAFPNGQGGTVLIGAERSGAQVRLLFSDDGAGIAPDVVGKIFDPFFTTSRGMGNAGLGLHLVFCLVTNTFGGSIECQSAPGQGCRFVMLLQAGAEGSGDSGPGTPSD